MGKVKLLVIRLMTSITVSASVMMSPNTGHNSVNPGRNLLHADGFPDTYKLIEAGFHFYQNHTSHVKWNLH